MEGYKQKHVVPVMKVITETRRTWWRLLQKHVVPDNEGRTFMVIFIRYDVVPDNSSGTTW